MRTALSIAGSDPSGGAGIQADLKTMIINGVYGMTVVTALTAQNTTGVSGILEVPPDFLRQQMEAVFTDIVPDAVKTGMIPSVQSMECVAECLKKYGAKNVVIDPVMVSTSGSSLMKPEAVDTMRETLFPLAAIVTPNIPEAEILSGIKISNWKDMEAAADRISNSYGCAVLCKGGHSLSDASDFLYWRGEGKWFPGRRIANPNTHGTGCTLSSAIAANLAKDCTIECAVENAKNYLSGALESMLDLGKGSGPLDHGFMMRHRG